MQSEEWSYARAVPANYQAGALPLTQCDVRSEAVVPAEDWRSPLPCRWLNNHNCVYCKEKELPNSLFPLVVKSALTGFLVRDSNNTYGSKKTLRLWSFRKNVIRTPDEGNHVIDTGDNYVKLSVHVWKSSLIKGSTKTQITSFTDLDFISKTCSSN